MATSAPESVTVELPRSHAGQRRVVNEARRFNWLAAGRRWRKTTLAMRLAVVAALRGQRIIWGAPTYDQVRVGWDETIRALGRYGTARRSEMVLEFPSRGRIIYRSLDDPDNARGHTADGAVIDEAGDVPERAWYEVVRPMLLDTDGWAWLLGTPRGRNYFWREQVNARDRADTVAWQIPTLGCQIVNGSLVRVPHAYENPEVSFSELLEMFGSLPERAFRQEILAEFLEDGGGVFRGVSKLATATRQESADPLHRYVLGVDLARRQDFTAIVAIDCALSPPAAVYVDRFNQIEWTIQQDRIQAAAERFRATVVAVDQTGVGDPVVEALRRALAGKAAVVGVQLTSASKPPLIETLALAFEREEIRLINDPILIAELQAYEQERLPAGSMRYSAPEGLHDDTVIALALGWQYATYTPLASLSTEITFTPGASRPDNSLLGAYKRGFRIRTR